MKVRTLINSNFLFAGILCFFLITNCSLTKAQTYARYADSVLMEKYIMTNTYAPIPFYESFEKTWINRDGIRDVPSNYFINNDPMGDGSWSQSGDGFDRGAWDKSWLPLVYNLSGANGSSYCAQAFTSSSLDLYLDFSSATGMQNLSFWYNCTVRNSQSADTLRLSVSTDGGKTFRNIIKIKDGHTLVWTKLVVSLGIIDSPQTIIRFNGINGGIDDIRISNFTANFSANVTSGAPPFKVNYTDLSSGNPSSWKWDFDGDGIIDDTTQNPSFIYTKTGTYNVKLIVSKNGIRDSITKIKYINSKIFASIPFYEGFENPWINNLATRDVPSLYFTNTPATGISSWSRNDDGKLRGAWNDNYFAYTPGGANGTNHSARFHPSSTPSFFYYGTFDLNLNFSGNTKEQNLTFWYLLPIDILSINISVDGGNTFKFLTRFGGEHNYSTWVKVTIPLGIITSPNVVIRFVGQVGYFYKGDIGLDEISIGENYLKPDFSANITQGEIPLTVNFSDSTSGGATSWKWDFNNDGIIDDTLQNPTHVYSTAGSYTVKLTAYNGKAEQSIVKNQYIKAKSYATIPFYEGFENSWINEDDHLNIPSKYCINSSSSSSVLSWGREDDNTIFSKGNAYSPSGANSNHSARYPSSHTNYTYDGNLDFNIDFSGFNSNKVLTFWHINQSTIYENHDFVKILVSKDGGQTFGDPLLSILNNQNWSRQIVQLGKFNSNKGVIRFNCYANGGNEYDKTDVGIDEILIQNLTDFSIDSASSILPFTIKFKDTSFGNPSFWKWDFNNDGIVDDTTQNPTFTYASDGKYTVRLITQNCGITDTITKENYILISEPNNIKTNRDNKKSKLIYPNPTFSTINLNLKDIVPTEIQIVDINGSIVQKLNPQYQSNDLLDISGLKPGSYFIKIFTKKIIYIEKFIRL